MYSLSSQQQVWHPYVHMMEPQDEIHLNPCALRCLHSVEESLSVSQMYVLEEYFLVLRLQIPVDVYLLAVTLLDIQLIFFFQLDLFKHFSFKK